MTQNLIESGLYEQPTTEAPNTLARYSRLYYEAMAASWDALWVNNHAALETYIGVRDEIWEAMVADYGEIGAATIEDLAEGVVRMQARQHGWWEFGAW